MLQPSDAVRFRQEPREIDSFRTISCGIGFPIPHEIVRNSRIFILQKKSMATLSVSSCTYIYIHIYIYVYIYTYVYMYVNMYILICYLMLIYICNICMNFSPIEPRYIILHFIILRLHLLYYIIHSFILYLNSPLLASVYTLSYIYIK